MSNIKIKSLEDNNKEEKPSSVETIKGKEKKPGIIKKIFKATFVFLFVVVIGGGSGVLVDKFLFPYLAATSFFEKYEFLKPEETKIIVQEKETVKIDESSVINEAINKVKPAVVTIIKDENKPQPQAYGSGFVITSDGLIVTNSHVVDNNQDKYIVFAQDGKSYDVDIIHIDNASSLIFLKIKADNLPVVSLGISKDLKLGQKVISLGYSGNNFQNQASLGIINNVNSFIMNNENNEQVNAMILADTEINMVNSGGPLIDLSGKVVGINVSGDKDNKVSNYILPIDLIKNSLNSVIEDNKIVRPKLGIKYVKITPYLVEEIELPKDYGLYLLNDDAVIPNGPADKAGLMKDDLIYAINDIEINQNKDLVQILENYNIGDEVEIKYIRDNQELSSRLKLGE